MGSLLDRHCTNSFPSTFPAVCAGVSPLEGFVAQTVRSRNRSQMSPVAALTQTYTREHEKDKRGHGQMETLHLAQT